MPFLLLFLIGATIGAIGNVAARMRTHRARFNTVGAGILGALLGGLWLSRVTGGGALPMGAAAAAVLVAALIGIRHRLVHRR